MTQYWVALATPTRAITDTDAYVAADGTTYPGQYDKTLIPGLIPVTMTARPDETPTGYTTSGEARGGVTVTGWHVALVNGVPTQVWDTASQAEMTVAEAQAVATAALSQSCAAAITAGFASAALGEAYTYPSTATDQANLVQVAATAEGGALWAASPAGAWAMVAHTQAQARQVLADFVAARNALQTRLATLSATVAAATTAAAALAVVW